MLPSKKEPDATCWAVIFRSRLSDQTDGYQQAAEAMASLAAQQPGCLGMETCRGEDGFGITISYWDSRQAIIDWRNHPEHTAVCAQGRQRWYSDYSVTWAQVPRSTIQKIAGMTHEHN